jgi:hypothetical protein
VSLQIGCVQLAFGHKDAFILDACTLVKEGKALVFDGSCINYLFLYRFYLQAFLGSSSCDYYLLFFSPISFGSWIGVCPDILNTL